MRGPARTPVSGKQLEEESSVSTEPGAASTFRKQWLISAADRECVLHDLKDRLRRNRIMGRKRAVPERVSEGVLSAASDADFSGERISSEEEPGELVNPSRAGNGDVGDVVSTDNSKGPADVVESFGGLEWTTASSDKHNSSAVGAVLGDREDPFTSERGCLTNRYDVSVLHGTRDCLYPVPPRCRPPTYLFVNHANPLLSSKLAMAGDAWLDSLDSKDYGDAPLMRPSISLDPYDALLLSVQNAEVFVQTLNGASPNTTRNIVGQLAAMCSFEEMIDKQRTSTANDLERLPATLHGDAEARLVNRYLVAKSFQRSDANKIFKATDVRPLVWCRKTIHNLLALHLTADCTPQPWYMPRGSFSSRQVVRSLESWKQLTCGETEVEEKVDINQLASENYTFLDVYNFLRDRFRSVWQDLTVQHCPKHRAFIESLEISFRFLVLSEELLCEEKAFNAVQNGDLMNTCLDKLMGGYADCHYSLPTLSTALSSYTTDVERSLFSVLVYSSPHEAEFWAYRIITTFPHSLENSNAVLDLYRRIPAALRDDSRICLAFSAHKAFRDRNACRYFKLIRQADYLLAILLHKFANLVRVAYLDVLISRSSRQHPNMPFTSFCKQFGFQDERLSTIEAFCADYHLRLEPQGGLSSGIKDWLPTHVNFAAAERLSAADLHFKRLRCRHFRSAFLSRRWEELELNRQTLVDPDFASHAAKRSYLAVCGDSLLQQSRCQPAVNFDRKVSIEHADISRVDAAYAPDLPEYGRESEQPKSLLPSGKDRAAVPTTLLTMQRLLDRSPYSGDVVRKGSQLSPLIQPQVELRYPFEGLVAAPAAVDVSKGSAKSLVNISGTSTEMSHRNNVQISHEISASDARDEICRDDEERASPPRFGLSDSQTEEEEELRENDSSATVGVVCAPRVVEEILPAVTTHETLTKDVKGEDQPIGRGVMKRTYQEHTSPTCVDNVCSQSFLGEASSATLSRKRRLHQKEFSQLNVFAKESSSQATADTVLDVKMHGGDLAASLNQEIHLLRFQAGECLSTPELRLCEDTCKTFFPLDLLRFTTRRGVRSDDKPSTAVADRCSLLLENGLRSTSWRLTFVSARAVTPGPEHCAVEKSSAVSMSVDDTQRHEDGRSCKEQRRAVESEDKESANVTRKKTVGADPSNVDAQDAGSASDAVKPNNLRTAESFNLTHRDDHSVPFVTRLFALLLLHLEESKCSRGGTRDRRRCRVPSATVTPCYLSAEEDKKLLFKSASNSELIPLNKVSSWPTGYISALATNITLKEDGLSCKFPEEHLVTSGRPEENEKVAGALNRPITTATQLSMNFIIPAERVSLGVEANAEGNTICRDGVVDLNTFSVSSRSGVRRVKKKITVPAEPLDGHLTSLAQSHLIWVVSHPIMVQITNEAPGTAVIASVLCDPFCRTEMKALYNFLSSLSVRPPHKMLQYDHLSSVTVFFSVAVSPQDAGSSAFNLDDVELNMEQITDCVQQALQSCWKQQVVETQDCYFSGSWLSEVNDSGSGDAPGEYTAADGSAAAAAAIKKSLQQLQLHCFCVAKYAVANDSWMMSSDVTLAHCDVERRGVLRLLVGGLESALQRLRDEAEIALLNCMQRPLLSESSEVMDGALSIPTVPSSVTRLFLREEFPMSVEAFGGSWREAATRCDQSRSAKSGASIQPVTRTRAPVRYLTFEWRERIEEAYPLIIIASWKRQVEQWPSTTCCPGVRELLHLLPVAIWDLYMSPYFDPIFWNALPTVSLLPQLSVAEEDRGGTECPSENVEGPYGHTGSLFFDPFVIKSLLAHLAKSVLTTFKATVTDNELSSLADFQTMGDFMSYVRRCVRLLLDTSMSEMKADIKLRLPFPLYDALDSVLERPWKGLPFPPQCYSGVWSTTLQPSKNVMQVQEKGSGLTSPIKLPARPLALRTCGSPRSAWNVNKDTIANPAHLSPDAVGVEVEPGTELQLFGSTPCSDKSAFGESTSLSRSRQRAAKLDVVSGLDTTDNQEMLYPLLEQSPGREQADLTSACARSLPHSSTRNSTSDASTNPVFVFRNPKGRTLGKYVETSSVRNDAARRSLKPQRSQRRNVGTSLKRDGRTGRVETYLEAVQHNRTPNPASELASRPATEGSLSALRSSLLGPMLQFSLTSPNQTCNQVPETPLPISSLDHSDDPINTLKRRLTHSLQKLRQEVSQSHAELNTASRVWAGSLF